MPASDWTSAIGGFLDIVLTDLASMIRDCPEEAWEQSMWDVTNDSGWGRPRPPLLPDGSPDPRGVGAYAAVWYATLHLVLTLDWNFSGRAPSWAPPPPFDQHDLDPGRLPARTYTREELLSYIATVHARARAALAAVAGDEAALSSNGETSAGWLISGFGHAMAHFGNLQTFLWQQRV